MRSSNFKITRVEVNEKEYESFFNQFIGKNIFSLDAKKINTLIKDNSIKTVHFKRIYPNTLLFNLEKRKPFLNVLFEENHYFTDENGILFNSKNEFNKKILKIDKIEKFEEAFAFSKKYFLNYEINTIEFVYLKGYLVFMIDNFKVYLKEKNKEKFFSIAINIYKKLREKNIKFKEIDLRYGYNHIIIR